MQLEKCAHCSAQVLYVSDYCPNCLHSRLDGALEPHFASLGSGGGVGNSNPRTWSEVFFSFRGRIPRSKHLLGLLSLAVFSWLGVLVDILLLRLLGDRYSMSQPPYGMVSLFVAMFLLWPTLALYVKRLADRNRSPLLLGFVVVPYFAGLFCLMLSPHLFLLLYLGFALYVIAVLGGIWLIVETWLLRGTRGSNEFGPDPSQNAQEVA